MASKTGKNRDKGFESIRARNGVTVLFAGKGSGSPMMCVCDKRGFQLFVELTPASTMRLYKLLKKEMEGKP